MPGHSYKGTAAPFRAGQANQAPILSSGANEVITWTWTGNNPGGWGVFDVGNIQPGATLATPAAGARSVRLATSIGHNVVIVGMDAGHTVFTSQVSNPVIVHV